MYDVEMRPLLREPRDREDKKRILVPVFSAAELCRTLRTVIMVQIIASAPEDRAHKQAVGLQKNGILAEVAKTFANSENTGSAKREKNSLC